MQTFTSKAIKLMVVAMTFMSFGAFAQSSGDSDLIFHFGFDGGSLQETSGNSAVTAADMNTIVVEDRFGNPDGARGFNGGYIDLNDAQDEAKNLSEFTLSAWVYCTSNSGDRYIFSQTNLNRDFVLMVHKGRFNFHTSIGGDYNWVDSPDSLPLNEWVHLTATWKNKEVNLYVNGVHQRSRTVDLDIQWTGRDLEIGSFYGGGGAFKGSIDDVKIFGRALSAEEIANEGGFCTKTVEVTVYDTVNVPYYDTVQVTVYDTVEVVERTTVTDTLVLDKITGLANGASNQMIAYPNPARDIVFVNTGDYSLMTGYSISVTNLQGQEVFVDAIDEQLIEIDVDALGAAGLYFLNVVNGSGEIVDSKKLLVK